MVGRHGGYGYGFTPLGILEDAEDVQQLVAGTVASFWLKTDPVRDAARLRAELETEIARGGSLERINELRWQLAAAERAVTVQREGEQSTREWRALGKLAASAGVLILVGGALYVLASAAKKLR